MKAKTISSEQVWQSPDGQKTIWNVVLEADGKEYPLKTFSAKIAEVGFEGELESYVNQRGDRFVKQAVPQQGSPLPTEVDIRLDEFERSASQLVQHGPESWPEYARRRRDELNGMRQEARR